MISSRVEDIDPSLPGGVVVSCSFSDDLSVAVDVSMAEVLASALIDVRSLGDNVDVSSTPASYAGCSDGDEDENHSVILDPIDEMSEGSVVSGCESVEPPGVVESTRPAPVSGSSRMLDGGVVDSMATLCASSGVCVEEGSVIDGNGVCPSDDSTVASASGGSSVEEDDEENHSLIFEPMDEINEGSVVSGRGSDDCPST